MMSAEIGSTDVLCIDSGPESSFAGVNLMRKFNFAYFCPFTSPSHPRGLEGR